VKKASPSFGEQNPRIGDAETEHREQQDPVHGGLWPTTVMKWAAATQSDAYQNILIETDISLLAEVSNPFLLLDFISISHLVPFY